MYSKKKSLPPSHDVLTTRKLKPVVISVMSQKSEQYEAFMRKREMYSF
jgi:hypothetical protein